MSILVRPSQPGKGKKKRPILRWARAEWVTADSDHLWLSASQSRRDILDRLEEGRPIAGGWATLIHAVAQAIPCGHPSNSEAARVTDRPFEEAPGDSRYPGLE